MAARCLRPVFRLAQNSLEAGVFLPPRNVRAMVTRTSSAQPSQLTADGSMPRWDIRMLYDGECPLCMKEVDFLRKRDAEAGRIDFVDIASDDYSPAQNAGLEFETVMGEIHALLPDGTIVTKTEVFRRLYEVVGLGWVWSITGNSVIGPVADRVYDFWAKYRLPVTGRPDLLTVMENRRKQGENCKPAREAEQAGKPRE